MLKNVMFIFSIIGTFSFVANASYTEGFHWSQTESLGSKNGSSVELYNVEIQEGLKRLERVTFQNQTLQETSSVEYRDMKAAKERIIIAGKMGLLKYNSLSITDPNECPQDGASYSERVVFHFNSGSGMSLAHRSKWSYFDPLKKAFVSECEVGKLARKIENEPDPDLDYFFERVEKMVSLARARGLLEGIPQSLLFPNQSK